MEEDSAASMSASRLTLRSWWEELAPDLFIPRSSEPDGQPPAGVSVSQPDSLLLSVSRRAMACEFEVLLNRGQFDIDVSRCVEALDKIEHLEHLLSVYKPRSDLSQVNRWGSGRSVPVEFETMQLLRLARDMHRLTSGAFDLTAGSLSEAWGFARRQGKMPTEAEIAQALGCCGAEKIELDELQRQVKLSQPGVRLNPGGIGKGFALDRAARHLLEHGIDAFMLHGGSSSIVARGDRQLQEVGGGWLVALKHPWRSDEQLGTIRLRNQGLGTSGSGKQFFHFGGKRYSHIIDPRSGRPAQEMMSATVIGGSGAVADALATALFVLGPDGARELCEQLPEVSSILIYSHPRSGSLQLEVLNPTDDLWLPRVRHTE